MLRNIRILETEHNVTYLLNEVLSLNAQEYRQAYKIPRHTLVLNEVLSLNAQEFSTRTKNYIYHHILNEVLSLNAQE